VLVYPNTSEVGLASLGFLKVHSMFQALVDLADISYLPTEATNDTVSRKQGLLLGAASRLEVSKFDMVAFSISYENDYLQVPGLLIRAGIPPLAKDRDEGCPLVVAGGFAMSINPLPVADFFDVCVVGEAEPVLPILLERIRELRTAGAEKATVLKALAGLPGVYIPRMGEHPVRRVWAISDGIWPEPVTARASHFGDMMLVEVGRGCGRGCLFCAAGNLYRPVRMRSSEVILEQARGAGRVGLVGTAVGDHPDIVKVIRGCTEAGSEVGISSMRVDQVNAEVAGSLVDGGLRSIAIAPEAGCEGLRRRLNKPFLDRQVVEAVGVLAGAGIRTVKLYFMIGLPGETDDGVRAIVGLVEDLARVKGRARLVVGAGPFVPKPHTAFQWYGFARRDLLRRRMALLKAVRRIPGCSLRTGSIDEAWSEAVLARGNRSLAEALLEAAKRNTSLRSVLKSRTHRDPCAMLDTQKPLPWDFIDSGVDRKRLVEQFEASGKA
jgi:radical SAM superfamily enzyme YgiQ (UPF0313 family)